MLKRTVNLCFKQMGFVISDEEKATGQNRLLSLRVRHLWKFSMTKRPEIDTRAKLHNRRIGERAKKRDTNSCRNQR